MILLPDNLAPAEAEITRVGGGFLQRSAGGEGATFIDRPGERRAVTVRLPPLEAELASVVAGRLRRGQKDGLRIFYPLMGISQGHPGPTLVDGIDSAGTTLKIKNGTPGHAVKEGYKLTLIDGDGVHYFHEVTATVLIAANGKATLSVEPPLRCFPADGDAVELGKPLIEGLVVSEVPERLPKSRLVELEFTLEEVDA